MRTAFKATFGILTAWGAYLFIVGSSGDAWSGLIFIYWILYVLPVTGVSLVLIWSIAIFVEASNPSSDVVSSVTSRSKIFAISYISLAVIVLFIYGYHVNQLAVASNTTASPEVVRTIYQSRYASYDKQIMQALASNTASPSDILRQLARHDDISIRRKVAYNTSTPSSVLSILSREDDVRIQRNVCNNPATTLTALAILAEDEKWNVRWCVASKQNLSRALLVKLSGDPSVNVRASVAGNEATPPDVLLMLSNDSHYNVRIRVSTNTSAPAAALVRLENDNNENENENK